MSVSPIGGVTGTSPLQQPIAAAQSAPTVDAAQAWEDAMRAAMGDESPPTAAQPAVAQPALQSSSTPTSATPVTPSPAQALTPQALAALVSGGSTTSADPLITSLSAATADATAPSPASAGSFV